MTDAASSLMPPPKGKASSHKKIKQWSRSIQDAVRKSRIANHCWKTAGRPPKEHATSIARRKSSRSVRAALRVEAAIARDNLYRSINKASTRDQKLFHSIIRQHRGSAKSTTILKVQGREIHDSTEAAEVMRAHFENLATPQDDPVFGS